MLYDRLFFMIFSAMVLPAVIFLTASGKFRTLHRRRFRRGLGFEKCLCFGGIRRPGLFLLVRSHHLGNELPRERALAALLHIEKPMTLNTTAPIKFTRRSFMVSAIPTSR